MVKDYINAKYLGYVTYTLWCIYGWGRTVVQNYNLLLRNNK